MALDNFLFFYELELGGIIIGFYHLIVYCLAILASIVLFILALIFALDVNFVLLGIGVVIAIIVFCVLIYFSWQLIMGVEFRDSSRVQKFRFLCMIGLCVNVIIVLSAITQVERFNLSGYHITLMVIYLIISFMTQIYIFLVIDSLYKRFRDEQLPNGTLRNV